MPFLVKCPCHGWETHDLTWQTISHPLKTIFTFSPIILYSLSVVFKSLRTTMSLSLTQDGAVFARLTPMLSLSGELKLASDKEFFSGRSESMEQSSRYTAAAYVELRQFKWLLKTFLFGEAAAHKWLFVFNVLCINWFRYSKYQCYFSYGF